MHREELEEEREKRRRDLSEQSEEHKDAIQGRTAMEFSVVWQHQRTIFKFKNSLEDGFVI